MKRWWTLLACQIVGILLAVPAFAGDGPRGDIDALRAEVVELKALVSKLTEQLSALNKRLSLLEQVTAQIGTNQPADHPDAAKPVDVKPVDARPYLRFPIEVERAMMLDGAVLWFRLQEMQRKRDPVQLLPALPEFKSRPRWMWK